MEKAAEAALEKFSMVAREGLDFFTRGPAITRWVQ